MANLAVTDLTFSVIRDLGRQGGTRLYRKVFGSILVPVTADYAAGGVPITGVTDSATGAVVAANALACPGLSCPNEVLTVEVLSNGNAAGLDDAFIVEFDAGTAGTSPHKLRIMKPPTPTVSSLTAAAQVFTGSALAAHRHTMHFQTGAAANAVTADTNQLRTAAAAFDVAGVANSSGEGGVVDVTAGTPAGTNAASAVTGTLAIPVRLIEHSNGALAEALTIYVVVLGW